MIRTLLITGPAERPNVVEQLTDSSSERTVELTTTTTVAQALTKCTEVDCVLLWAGSDTTGMLHALDVLMLVVGEKPVIVLTDVPDSTTELEFFRRGARDYLTDSDVREGRLVRSIAYAVARYEPEGRGQHSDQHYRSIVEALGEGVIVQSGDGTILSMNRRAGEIFGLTDASPDEQKSSDVGWVPRDVTGRELTPEERPGYRCFTSGQPVRNQLLSMTLPDGTNGWVEVSSYPLRHAANASAHGVVTVLRDVSEQRANEESIRFQAMLLDAVGQSVVATDLDGHIMYWNKASETIFGWTSEEVVGRDVLTVTTFEAEHVSRVAVAQAVGGAAWTGDFWSRRRDGTRFPMLVTNTPVHDVDGNVTGRVGVTTDISERVDSESANLRLSNIVESSTDAIYGTDLAGQITSWNGGAVALYGYTAQQMVGSDVRILYPDELLPEQGQILKQMRAGRSFHAADTVRRRADGTLVEVSVKASPVLNSDGRPIAAAAIARDITHRKTLERRLARDRDQLADAQSIAKLGSFELDPQTGQQVWSAELYRLLGVDPAAVPDDTLYMSAVHPADRRRLSQAIRAAVEGGTSLPVTEHRVSLPDGTLRWVSAHADSKGDGRVVGAVLDITDRKLAEQALLHQSLHDPLTDLPNRLMLERALHAAVRRTVPDCAALMFLDIDRFKVINDGLGHGAGDKLLVAVGERLSAWATAHDTVARFGGDEFVILCEHVGSMATALERSTELVALCELPFIVGERQVLLTVSIGVAEVSVGTDAERILSEADAAMYSAKEHGRARVVMADQALREHAAERLGLETDLRKALERQEFCLHYQPVYDLHTDRVIGYEALIRWNHPNRGLVYPDGFIELAEETGLIVPIGRWVLHEALTQLASWRSVAPAMHGRFVAVNLSTVQLYDFELARQVSAALEATGVDPHSLHLEITETALMDIDRATKTLTALKAIGVEIDLDDFGTGYSSLSYVQQLPIDTVKIDRSFVSGLATGNQNLAIVAAVVSLGHALGLRVLAEGVETPDHRDQLRVLGCDAGQGYLWSRPLPPERIQRVHASNDPRRAVFV
jgi:diguanylate cyclase (GGDEF)-like protein/PAS domain S-box-containing protein